MILQVIDRIFLVYSIMLFVRIMVSWAPELANYRLVQFIAYYTDPYLNLFRRIIPPLGMLDISPIFAFIALGFIQSAVTWCVTWLLL